MSLRTVSYGGLAALLVTVSACDNPASTRPASLPPEDSVALDAFSAFKDCVSEASVAQGIFRTPGEADRALVTNFGISAGKGEKLYHVIRLDQHKMPASIEPAIEACAGDAHKIYQAGLTLD